MHGASKRRGKQSEYATQLQEKQKVKYTYGVLERQFENLFHRASSREGITGTNLLQLLEARLDNAVYRLGIAPTRSGARQLVGHKHITVNGEVVNIASYSLKPGDVISVREKSKSLEAITNSVAGRKVNKYTWFEWDAANLTGKLLNYPNRDEIPENIKENLIVELYSK
jgi:small subunit ribosomal protein S4